jgi:glycosyltransferase involved in cell wall biosynthesis
MHILLLNQYFPPDTSATAKMASLVQEALSRRHHVTVVAGRPSYAPDERHPYYLLRRERGDSVTVERVGSTSFDRRRMSGRLANFLSYLVFAFIRAATVRPKPDVVLAMTDPPLVGLVGALVSMMRRSRFVYNVRDLHPDMAVAAGAVKAGFLVSLWERLHRWTLNRAHLVIALGDDMRERILAKGVSPGRAVVVRDGTSPLESHAVVDGSVHQEIRGGFDFVVLHGGNLGFAGCWETLIRAARSLESERTGFVFVGDGSRRDALEAEAKGLSNVRFLPFYPVELLPQVLDAADLHVVTVRKGLEGLVVPSKLYPIMAAGKPVLAVAPPDSDVVRIVRKYGFGLVADPEDPEEVAAAVRSARSDPDRLKRMAERAREASLEFAQELELKRFSDLVEEVAGGR